MCVCMFVCSCFVGMRIQMPIDAKYIYILREKTLLLFFSFCCEVAHIATHAVSHQEFMVLGLRSEFGRPRRVVVWLSVDVLIYLTA